MTRLFLFRLWLDGLTAALLLLGFAYWWMGNVVHEVAGTSMFVLLIAHNIFNRRWWAAMLKTRRAPRSLFNLGVTWALLAAMLALVVTSTLISNALAPYLPPWGGFTMRQIHTLSAYWVLVIVAIHLGLRRPMLMGVGRTLFGIKAPSRSRTVILRAIVLAVALHGAWSCIVLGLGGKLSMRMTLDWWNFEESVAGFFIHCGAAAGMVMVLTYYGLRLMQSADGRSKRGGQLARTASVAIAQGIDEDRQSR